MNQSQITFYLTLWAAIGPLAGIVLGNYLTRSAHHKQWLRDNRKEEFKELMSALVAPGIELLFFQTMKNTPLAQPLDLWVNARKIAIKTFSDRIYIADDLKKGNLFARYREITKGVETVEDYLKAADDLQELMDEVIALAEKD